MLQTIRGGFGFVVAVGLLCSLLLGAAFAAPSEQIGRPRPDLGTAAQDAGFHGAWRDREIRSTYVEDTDETEVLLTLLPVDPQAGEPRITLTFQARYAGGRPVVPPGQIQLRVTVGPLVDPNVMRRPVLNLVLDEDSDDRVELEFVGLIPTTAFMAPGDRVDTILITLPLGMQFLELLNAETVTGQALGIFNFSLDQGQLAALRAFANQILSIRPSGL